MKTTTRIAAALIFAGLLALAGWAGVEEAEECDLHPPVDGAVTADACDVCHRTVTPEIVDEWFASKHGEMNVKCFVCHGSTGEDFVREPDAVRCIGCHADQVTSMDSAFMQGATCATCHLSHLLDPHRQLPKEGGAQ